MYKSGEKAALEEVTIEEEIFKGILFLLRADKSVYGQIFEYLMKLSFSGRDEYPETINGQYKLLVRTSSQFGGIMLRGGRQSFRN